MGAVIAQPAFERLAQAIARAKADADCRLVFGGGSDDGEGFFVEPTLFEVARAPHFLLSEELFGPVVGLFVYDDDRYAEVLRACDSHSRYALTGSIFARDDAAIAEASRSLRFSAGNFYVNDKPTGAVVGQQPFGGARRSGTNDKAGCLFHLLRWVSPRVIKHNLNPPRDFRYPFLEPDETAS
ncbi:MAG: aldehyde dehydrogenase family protein [Polyangiaceae bacterium]